MQHWDGSCNTVVFWFEHSFLHFELVLKMCTISLQCAFTTGTHGGAQCVLLAWDYSGMWGARKNRSCNQADNLSGTKGCWSFLAFFWKEKRTFLLIMSLFQNLFEMYIITASGRICLFWHWGGVGVVFDTSFAQEFYNFFFPPGFISTLESVKFA